MILAILIAYKAVNDKSLSIRINESEGEYVANNVIIDGVYGKTININDIVGIQFQK